MKCPNCETPLRLSERRGVEIDFCPTCRGVWLDRGELDKIIERSDELGARRGGQDNGDDRRDEDRHTRRYKEAEYHKKKSFWHELFD